MRKRTLRQIESARANAQKSTGPITEKGKSRSSANALKHTAYSENVLLHAENDDEFGSLLAAYTAHWQPSTQPEHDLVRDIAIARWRLDRNVAIETAAVGLQIVRMEESLHARFNGLTELDVIASAWSSMADNGRLLALLSRHENSLRRTIARATAELCRLKKVSRNEAKEAQPAPNQQFAGNNQSENHVEAA